MPETIYIHVDGAVSGNPGPATVGVVLREENEKRTSGHDKSSPKITQSLTDKIDRQEFSQD